MNTKENTNNFLQNFYAPQARLREMRNNCTPLRGMMLYATLGIIMVIVNSNFQLISFSAQLWRRQVSARQRRRDDTFDCS